MVKVASHPTRATAVGLMLLAVSVLGPVVFALTPLERLHLDLLAATRTTGVERAVWGIAVHSLDRDERLFELGPGLTRQDRQCGHRC